jgi:FOG: CheY-like receiver
MSEDFQKHLFESFSRESDASVSKEEGAGLGLAIVKRIVDLAGGTISVRSRKGEGSTFVIDVPFRIMDEKAIRELVAEEFKEEEISDASAFKGKSVLLVEDNEMNREIAEEILEDAGFEIESVEDGIYAIDMLKEKGPEYYDFVLMDIQMPVMNGYEATKAIREMFPDAHIPIIAVSANAFEEDKKASIAAGMDDHVAKPIVIKELFTVLAKYL